MSKIKQLGLKRALVPVATVASIIAVLVGIYLVSPLYLGTTLMNWFRGTTPFLLIVAALLLVAAGWAVIDAWRTSYSAKGALLVAGVSIVVVGVTATTLSGLNVYRFDFNARSEYAVNLTESRDIRPTYDPRENLPQARLAMQRSLQDVVGQLSDLTYITTDNPEWCGLIEQDGPMGRRWTRRVVCRDSHGKVRSAEFNSEKVGTAEGMWGSRLAAQVVRATSRGVTFNADDVYGYIGSDGKANLVVPVIRSSGFGTAPHEVTAGIVTFDADGNSRWLQTVKPGETPGPVASMHMARQVREALNTREGIVGYHRQTSNPQALQGTGQTGSKTTTDPNADNPTEFVMRRADGRTVFVTPMTPYGASTNIVAYLEVEADTVTAGVMPHATLYRLGRAEASNQAMVQEITRLYDADVDFADLNKGGDESNKARIFELTPTKPGSIVATIGTGSGEQYRVTVESTLNETGTFGELCIHRTNDGSKIRCDRAGGDAAPLGALRGLNNGTGDDPTPKPTLAPGNPGNGTLAGVPTEELIAELARRYPTSTPPTTTATTTAPANAS